MVTKSLSPMALLYTHIYTKSLNMPCLDSGKLPLGDDHLTQSNLMREDCVIGTRTGIDQNLVAHRPPIQSHHKELEANVQLLDEGTVVNDPSRDKTPHPTMKFKLLKRIPKATSKCRLLTVIINKILRWRLSHWMAWQLGRNNNCRLYDQQKQT